MTPEVQLVDNYNKWLTCYLEGPDVGDMEKLRLGLSDYITAQTILNEPPSLPWGGTLVGFDGWVSFFKRISPIMAKLGGQTVVSPATYYQEGNIVLREYTSTTTGTPVEPANPIAITLIEKYTLDGGRITRIQEFMDDSGALADRLILEGAMPPRTR